jgi:hypothetical protein
MKIKPSKKETKADEVTRRALAAHFGGPKPTEPIPTGYEALLNKGGGVGYCVGVEAHEEYIPDDDDTGVVGKPVSSDD